MTGAVPPPGLQGAEKMQRERQASRPWRRQTAARGEPGLSALWASLQPQAGAAARVQNTRSPLCPEKPGNCVRYSVRMRLATGLVWTVVENEHSLTTGGPVSYSGLCCFTTVDQKRREGTYL